MAAAPPLSASLRKWKPRRGGALAAVYVHWNGVNPLLRGAVTITLSWGTDVWLLSDVTVSDECIPPGPSTPGGGRFRWRRHNESGVQSFVSAYSNLLNHPSFERMRGHLREVERRNHVRYQILLNFMAAEGLDEVVHVDSDVALLAAPEAIFPRSVYRRCDSVLTYNQVSSRWMPVNEGPLEAFWAGTALLSRAVLEAYNGFARDAHTDPLVRQLLIRKMQTLPTVNDMTTWCLFTLVAGRSADLRSVSGSDDRASKGLLATLRHSAFAMRHAGKHTLCNTQPVSWAFDAHGIVPSASAEVRLTWSTPRELVSRRGGRLYLDGEAYHARYVHYWRSQLSYAPATMRALSPGRTAHPTSTYAHRLLTLHDKDLGRPAVTEWLAGGTDFNGTLSAYVAARDKSQTREHERRDRICKLGVQSARG